MGLLLIFLVRVTVWQHHGGLIVGFVTGLPHGPDTGDVGG